MKTASPILTRWLALGHVRACPDLLARRDAKRSPNCKPTRLATCWRVTYAQGRARTASRLATTRSAHHTHTGEVLQ